MKRKVVLVLFVMFVVKFFFSCYQVDDDCNCDDSDLMYSEMRTSIYENSSAEGILIPFEEDKQIEKENLVLSVYFETSSVASNNYKLNFSNLGFSSAYACSCVFKVENAISDIKIYAINEETNEKIDVSVNFQIETDISATNSITELLLESDLSEIENFELYLINEENIPETTIFEIEVTLEDSSVLTNKTKTINFIL